MKLLPRERARSDPLHEVVSGEFARSELEHHALLFVHGRAHLVAIQHQERLHRGMPRSFVPIYERVSHHERESEGCCLLDHARVEVLAAKARPWLRHRGLQCSQVPNAGGAPSPCDDPLLECDHLAKRQVPHQARRRYSSSFFRSTCSAASRKSSSSLLSRSARAARARASGSTPKRAASARSFSSSASVSSMESFILGSSRGACRPTRRCS